MPATSPGPILVVDDDDAIRATVRDILDFEGYAVLTAPDGAAALRLAEQTAPACVLLDMRMPVLDGWGFAREARARGHHFPIVVMTAASDANAWCREIGGDACVPKPFQVDEMLDAIQRVLESQQARC
jgi:CheY-like chemotaxis protein